MRQLKYKRSPLTCLDEQTESSFARSIQHIKIYQIYLNMSLSFATPRCCTHGPLFPFAHHSFQQLARDNISGKMHVVAMPKNNGPISK